MKVLLKTKKIVVENWPIVVGALVLVVLIKHCGTC